MTPARGAALFAVATLLFGADASAAEKGTVTFVVRDHGGNDLDAKLTIDDTTAPIPLGRSTALEPGIHDVHWSLANGQSGTTKLTVIEGQQGRIFLITTPVNVPVPVPVHVPPVRDHDPTDAPRATAEPPEPTTPWPYILLAGGATLAVTSAVFQLVAINEDSDAQNYFWHSTRDDLLPSTRDALARSSNSHFDAAQTNQTIAITCGVLAVTAVTAAVTWFIVRR